MVKCTFLISTHDNDGTQIVDPIQILDADLMNVFGGFTKMFAIGFWKDNEGKRYDDQLLAYWVVIEDYRVTQLVDLLHDFKHRTLQKEIWLDQHEVRLTLI